jgi:hypothetical protein
MKWTTDLPTVTGHYWVKVIGEISDKIYYTVVHVYPGSPNSTKPDTIFWDGVHFNIEDSPFLAYSGPISEPEE